MQEKTVQTIDRAIDIIELLSTEKEGMGVTDIGKRLDLHKSTVHRLLNALAERGYIEKEPKHGYYKIGLKFIEITSLYLNKLELKTEAQPYLRRLAEIVGQPVHLAILDGGEAVYIEKIEALNSMRMYSQIGKRVPVHCSAIGKVLLSGLEKNSMDALLDKYEFSALTKNTIKTKNELARQVQNVRKLGFAVDDEEHEQGVRCIAAPVYDYTGRIIAAVSVSGDKRILEKNKDEEISMYVIDTAGEISKRMGYIK
jgi:IclR family KDG regulon transcriptional repressor